MALRPLVLWVSFVALLLASSTDARRVQSSPRLARALDDHGHADEGLADCAIDKRGLALAFNEVAAEMNLTGSDSALCSLPEPECQHGEDEEEGEHHDEDGEIHDHEDIGSGAGDSQCIAVYSVCKELLLHTNLIASSCLSECLENGTSSSSNRPTKAQAYGYGFLMIMLVSLGSLIGVVIVPLIDNDSKKKLSTKALVYKYVYSFMIALGTSALICDAILHLIPHAWELHAHEDETETEAVDDHAHAHGKGVEDFLWKGSVVLLAIYAFYLLESVLHSFSGHSHSHGVSTGDNTDSHIQQNGEKSVALDMTVPHGTCKEENRNMVHPGENEKDVSSSKQSLLSKKGMSPKGLLCWLRHVKPLVWLIVIGDGLHNFADGLALGAAMSQSLGLGLSTAIALLFHEIPHEFGDYVILISTGITWYSALVFNFASALTAVLGFFIGVAAGTQSEETNAWILAFAAGLFIYIALVDLMPLLIHSKKNGHRIGLLLIENIGFFISFIILFIIAVYEEDLNSLISD